MGLAKPYAVQHGDRQDYYLRYGNTCRIATREQMLRRFESGGLLSVERTPVHGSTVDELYMRRLDEYFRRILGDDDVEDWRRTLLPRELLVEPTPAGEPCCSCAAYVLFAIQPSDIDPEDVRTRVERLRPLRPHPPGPPQSRPTSTFTAAASCRTACRRPVYNAPNFTALRDPYLPSTT